MKETLQGKREAQYQKILKEVPALLHASENMSVPENDAEAAACRYVWGPVLGSFVRWILLWAQGHGIRRLYFLARDGYFMYQAAELFCQAFQIPLACRYVSCSRYSLRLPLLYFNHAEALSYIWRKGLHVTPTVILKRAGLSPAQQKSVADRLFPGIGMEERLSDEVLLLLQKALSEDAFFLECMDRRSQKEAPLLAGYLRQEGLLDGTPDLMIDSGWLGSMQQTLNQALLQLGRKQPLSGCYWGLYDHPRNIESGEYASCFFSPEKNLKEKVFFNNCLFEAVYTAPHGTTLFYRKEGSYYMPQYGQITKTRVQATERIGGYLLQYIRLFIQEMKKGGLAGQDVKAEHRTFYRLLRLLMTEPSYGEAAAFGRLPFTDDVVDGETDPLAARLTEEEFKRNHVAAKYLASKKGGESVRESAWYAGSAVLYSRCASVHIRQYILLQYLRHLKNGQQFNREEKKQK